MSTATSSQIARDRWGRPLVVPDQGGAAIPYDRISSAGKVLEDGTGLDLWKQRMVARGVALHPHLAALAASSDDTRTLNKVAKDALEAAGGSSAAGMGTAVHTFTEQVDRGIPATIPANLRPTIDGYTAAIEAAGLEPVTIEEFVVVDDLQYAGTLDRVYRSRKTGRYYVGDVKTGRDAPNYAAGIAVQVALYAHGRKYSPDTGHRSDILPVDQQVGLLIHLPTDGRPCTIHTLDLASGWDGAKVARWVKTWRKYNPCAPLTPTTVV